MRSASVLILLSAACANLSAQDSPPQLTWSGYVAGSATLFIQGDHVDAQGRATGDIDRPRFNFRTPLPAARTKVDMEVRQGRGRVVIAEQPEPGNEYSAVVQIDTNSRQPELYRLEFFWESPGRGRSSRDGHSGGQTGGYRGAERNGGAGTGELRWSGDVDEEAVIEIRGDRAGSRVTRGQSITNEQIEIAAPMPRRPVAVRLEDARGRGRVEVVEQPDLQNGYIAVVRIRDNERGRAPYAFRLTWDSEGEAQQSLTRNERPNDPRGQEDGYARWSGRVDGTARITLQGNRATSTTVSGQAVSDMNADFGGGPGIPGRGISEVQIRKVRGRGEVRLVEQPSGRNGFSLVFEVEDRPGGSDSYEVEITWR